MLIHTSNVPKSAWDRFFEVSLPLPLPLDLIFLSEQNPMKKALAVEPRSVTRKNRVPARRGFILNGAPQKQLDPSHITKTSYKPAKRSLKENSTWHMAEAAIEISGISLSCQVGRLSRPSADSKVSYRLFLKYLNNMQQLEIG